jgi:hypothetical protein
MNGSAPPVTVMPLSRLWVFRIKGAVHVKLTLVLTCGHGNARILLTDMKCHGRLCLHCSIQMAIKNRKFNSGGGGERGLKTAVLRQWHKEQRVRIPPGRRRSCTSSRQEEVGTGRLPAQ